MGIHFPWRRLTVFALCLVCSVLLLSGFMLPHPASSHLTASQGGATTRAENQCALASMKGTYLFAFNGVILSGKNQIPASFAGWVAFDGSGHVHGFFSQSVNGTITRLIHYIGTSTVDAKCMATETDTTDAGVVFHFDEFTTPDGHQFSFVETDPQTLASGIATRETTQVLGG